MPGLLDDPDDLPQPLRLAGRQPGRLRVVPAPSRPHRAEQRLRLVAVEREQEQLLLARRQPLGVLAELVERLRLGRLVQAVAEQLHGSLDGRVDLGRRGAVAPLDQVTELVDHEAPALRGEHVQKRLRAEHLPDRRRQRRPAALAADGCQLLEHLVEAVGRRVLAQPRLELGDQSRRERVLGRTNGHAGRQRRHRLVPQRDVHELGAAPESIEVDAGVQPDPGERLRQRLGGDAVERERDRVERDRDPLRPRAHGLDRRREANAPGALAVEADGQAAGLAHALYELAGLRRVERAGGVVDQHPRGAKLGQLVRAFEQHVRLAGRARAVYETHGELLPGVPNRVGGLTEIREVVERVVESEDVDAAARGARHEAADDVGRHRPSADEEAAAQGHAERRRAARANRPDPLPRALDAAADGAVEAASAGDLEAREAGLVELRSELVQPRRGDSVGERLLREKPDRRVDELRNDVPSTPGRCSGARGCRP